MISKKDIEELIHRHKLELLKIVEDEKDVDLYITHLIMKMCSDCDYIIDHI